MGHEGIFQGIGLLLVVLGAISFVLGGLTFLLSNFIVIALGALFIGMGLYNIESISKASMFFLGWGLGIYGIALLFFMDASIIIPGVNLTAWYFLYPSIIIFYYIQQNYIEKNDFLASALDALTILSIILVGFAGYKHIETLAFQYGLFNTWLEFYIVGVGLMLYSILRREQIQFSGKISSFVVYALYASGCYLIIIPVIQVLFRFFGSIEIWNAIVFVLAGGILIYAAYRLPLMERQRMGIQR